VAAEGCKAIALLAARQLALSEQLRDDCQAQRREALSVNVT